MLVRDEVVYEFGSIRIDPCKRTIGRNGENIPFPSRAFDVLLLLLQRRGELVTKEELLSRIWPNTHVEEANLPVMISAVRRVIGDDGRKQKYIQTVSKCGYRFIGELKETCVVTPIAPAPPEPTRKEAMHFSAEPVPPSIWRRFGRSSVVSGCTGAALAVAFMVHWLSGGNHTAGAVVVAAEAVPGEARKYSRPSSGAAEMWVQKGRYAWNLQTKAGFLQSIEYYQKAIAEDAGNAAAYAGLAEAYVILPSYSERNNDEERGRARTAAMKALALDDRLADAHVASGMVFLIDDRSFSRGAHEFRRAIELNPRSPLAQGELALCLVAVGRNEEAVSHARQAKALDPLSIRAATDLGIVLYYSHRFTEAETEFEEALKLDPYSYRTHLNLGKTYLALGRFDDARRVLEEASLLANHDPLAEGLTAEAKARVGDIAGARSILAALQQRAKTTYVAPISFAFAFAGLGRVDDTLVYLRKARADRAIAALFLKVDPNWDALHGSRDFRRLVSDIALTTDE
ncbi:MAG: tetratricopeptide repeat protein [Bryobacteraceae bacterium]|jgi:DNA-binding winged helix-turn-helix (wHTH) protein/Flp pilus assembly protein TadD